MTPSTHTRRPYRIHCPHCRARAIVRTSYAVTDDVRQLHAACSDAECGHEFGAVAEQRITITHSIRPSLKPAAGVTLLQVPLRPRAATDRIPQAPVPVPIAPPIPANDSSGPEVPPLAANDDHDLTEAV